jgi:hypothetical protein
VSILWHHASAPCALHQSIAAQRTQLKHSCRRLNPSSRHLLTVVTTPCRPRNASEQHPFHLHGQVSSLPAAHKLSARCTTDAACHHQGGNAHAQT